MKRKSPVYIIFSLIFFVGVMLFLWLGCPQYLMYHEQYQLFLFTREYFVQTVSLPGGLADYLSEFVVQFYYVPLYGALFAALILTLSQVLLGLSLRRSKFPEVCWSLSALPSILYLGAMSDENILFSFAMSMLLTSLFLFLFSLRQKTSFLSNSLALIVGFALLYWLAGPFAFVFVVAGGIMSKRLIATLVSLTVACTIVFGIHALWFEQYPLGRFFLGINYFRVPEFYPPVFYIIAAVTSLLPLLTIPLTKNENPKTKIEKLLPFPLILIFAFIYVPMAFDKGKGNILAYDALVRQGRWTDIIAKAKKERPKDLFSLQALNLALGMTGQLTESMFQFNQQGVEGLIGRDRLDNTTQLITAEVLYRLGLTNIAFSTTFDLQEAIMNDRKSGRLLKRMAECMIVNGNYKVASKYLGILGNSLFYSDWARKAGNLIGNDHAVESHPVYGPLRRNAFKKVAFYDHTQLDKILAMHAVDSEGFNTLAWQYFCAAAMLKGDLNTLAGVYNFSSDKFGQGPIPRHIQEAMAMYWTFSHSNFEGIPFSLSREVQQQTAALAQAVTRNQNNPAAWEAAAPGSYGVYFLKKSHLSQKEDSSPQYIHTHE